MPSPPHEARSQIDAAAAGVDPEATFAHNEEFWTQWTRRQAVYLSAVRDRPSKFDLMIDSVRDASAADAAQREPTDLPRLLEPRAVTTW